MCTRTAAWETENENADDYLTISNILLTRSKDGSSVFNPSFSVTNYIARQHFGDFSLTQHRNRRKHPPTYLAEPHQGADSRTFAASFWRFSQGHEHSPALILVKRVFNSASQCERSRRVWQAIESEGKPAAAAPHDSSFWSASLSLSPALSATHPFRRDASTALYLSAGCALKAVQKAITLNRMLRQRIPSHIEF
jgi:hypothetical protein